MPILWVIWVMRAENVFGGSYVSSPEAYEDKFFSITTMQAQSLPGNQFEALFEFATVGILVTNHKGEITAFNQWAEHLFGWDRKEIIGQPVDHLLPDAVRAKHAKLKETFIQHPGNRPMGINRDLFGKRKDGKIFPVEISLSHYFINDQVNVIAFIIDITVRKQNEEALMLQQKELERVSLQIRRLNAELEQKVDDRTKMLKETLHALELSKAELGQALQKEKELSDMKSKFVSMASHEFRTPLSTILSSASLVGKYDQPEDSEKRNKHLSRIKGSVENMRDILEDFLSLGKMEEGLIRLHPEKFSAEELNEEISRLVGEMQILTRPGQEIIYEGDLNESATVDQKMLRHVLTNLISNAIKFSPNGKNISVKASSGRNLIKLIVQDKGLGIPEENQKRLFERFYRAENVTNIQGTGLGLYIVSRYVELAHGSIDFVSKIGEGTIFSISLPCN